MNLRQRLTEKYGTPAFGALTTPEEKEALYQEETPEYYALEKKRDELLSELRLMEANGDDKAAPEYFERMMEEYVQTLRAIRFLDEASLAEFHNR